MKVKVSIGWTGLPRFLESTVLSFKPNSMKVTSLSYESVTVWDFGSVEPPATFVGSVVMPRNEDDWQSLERESRSQISRMAPVSRGLASSADPLSHPAVSALGLKPLPSAMLSWMTAISRAASALKAHGDPTDDFWIICRADMRIFPSSLERLLRKLSKTSEPGVVFLTGRNAPHRVLETGGEFQNLPIDHLIIGRPGDIQSLAELEAFALDVYDGMDVRQPMVSEFVLGQFLHDCNLRCNSVFFGALLWRGSWRKSFTPPGDKSIKARIGIYAIEFLRNLVFPRLRRD